jgi:mono/diheme cytochrome c family protein
MDKRNTVALLGLLVALAAGFVARGTAQQTAAAANQSLIERGRYITHDLAMCVQCHTPRDEAGRLIPGQEFRGAPVPAVNTIRGMEWALRAPNIAGLVGFTDEQEMQLLTRGQADGRPAPQPPMPPFRMTPEDARAVIAYLRTLD